MKTMIWCLFWLLTCGATAPAETGPVPVLSESTSVQSTPFPAAVILLPPGEHAVLVEKQTQRLYIYGADPVTGGVTRVVDTACSTGEVPGPKQLEGDKKTPEGIYFIIDEHLEKDLTPTYGPRAFPTDYPHLLDRRQGKTGYAIWIHGTDKPLKPMDTNGCVALENADVRRLSGYVTLHVTPVIIEETIQYADPETIAKQEIEVTRFVAGWLRTHLTGTGREFDAMYLPGSLPDSRNWEIWEYHRRLAAQAGEPFRIQISQMGIYHYQGMFVAAMDFELIQGQAHHLMGRRRLFIQPDDLGRFRIAGDDFQDPDRPRPALALLAAGAERLLGSR
ncbi:MAG: murein L,D-transpeptidase family protein [Desulfotignum sp.]